MIHLIFDILFAYVIIKDRNKVFETSKCTPNTNSFVKSLLQSTYVHTFVILGPVHARMFSHDNFTQVTKIKLN